MGTKMMSDKAKYVFGYDICPNAIEFADEHFSAPNISYSVADIKNIPCKGSKHKHIIYI